MRLKIRQAALPILLCSGMNAFAQQVETHFSCSMTRDDDGEKVTYADSGEMRLSGDRIASFRWESSLFRSTHGFDCSIDESDGLLAEVHDEGKTVLWRIALSDAHAARIRRGFTFERSGNCTIRLVRNGDMLNLKPSCPALCGSRANFTELSVDLKTGSCHYEQ
ncbi:hypothetical protein [Noviherbaspirillum autotrophicum]|uniref:Uncharacterized protein n=1 Tax=Noviherbaspirillum autotrophicum TaxID=709839 RepID=A0A0C2BP24_9BURK|nr:hypothetical protein [Noviherbaspirillum autotrophicum]KIF83025.1 hypothetical protein TSA66_22840 [Noviherbaspirillum autotrophicum]